MPGDGADTPRSIDTHHEMNTVSSPRPAGAAAANRLFHCFARPSPGTPIPGPLPSGHAYPDHRRPIPDLPGVARTILARLAVRHGNDITGHGLGSSTTVFRNPRSWYRWDFNDYAGNLDCRFTLFVPKSLTLTPRSAIFTVEHWTEGRVNSQSRLAEKSSPSRMGWIALKRVRGSPRDTGKTGIDLGPKGPIFISALSPSPHVSLGRFRCLSVMRFGMLSSHPQRN